jgi:hypothetical protein
MSNFAKMTTIERNKSGNVRRQMTTMFSTTESKQGHARQLDSRIVKVSIAIEMAIAVVVFAMAVIGCSGDSAPPAPTRSSLGGNGAHAIHVIARHADGSKATLSFGPATDARFSGTEQPPSHTGPSQQNILTGIHTAGPADGGVPIQAPPSIGSPSVDPWSTAWALVWRAVAQCGTFPDSKTDLPWTGFDPSIAWYMYTGESGSCSARLQIEQNLVCVADKLAAIADAVGTVVWPAPFNPNDTAKMRYGAGDPPVALLWSEWDIPPQSDGDRFIVRDLAIHTLAMLPTLDAYTDIAFPAPLPQSKMTCGQAFAWLANPANTPANTCIGPGISGAVFGTPAYYGTGSSTSYVAPNFPPSSTALCDAFNNYAPAIAQTALDIEAQILRSGGRLLHDLIRRDVYSDMAAAAQQSAQALDPVLGNANAWGQAAGGSYGTISHAARVLVGRWEIGTKADFGTVADPQCESIPALGILPGAFGDELSARVQDRPIRTPGEQTATVLVERSGIVLPSCQISVGSAATLRQALIDQLLLQEKVQNNLSAPPPAAALTNVVGKISDGELIFAFQRALRTWRLMTNSADTTAVGGAPGGGTPPCVALGDQTGATPLPAGLMLDAKAGTPTIASSVRSVLGIVVQGGLGRSRLITDPMARAGGMTEASQCGDSNVYWDEWGSDLLATVGPLDPSIAIPRNFQLPPAVFQDAFHVGQALQRRLNVLQTAAAGLPSADPGNVARGGIAELRSWAGSTIVHAWPLSNGASFVVRVAGMSYGNDFSVATGAAPDAAVLGSFGFVYGPPWVAECAAHVRADCPSNFDNTYVQPATQFVDLTVQYAQPNGPFAAAGVLDNVFQLTVPLGTNANFKPTIVDFESGPRPSESHLYMVRLRDTTDPLGHGRVLGTIPLRAGRGPMQLEPRIVGFVDSPMQRELVHDAIDLGRWVGARPPALGDPSAAQTAGYCVDGVPRDLFVPLDNELVSGSATYEKSWQAYLDLAQQAAQTADALGQQLIANNLEISKNRQVAEEQLANICGDFGALSTATVASNGTITAGPEDPTTQACLSEPMIDVVFLGTMPKSIPSSGDQTCAIKAAIHCAPSDMMGCTPPTTSAQAPVTALQLCKKSTLTAGELGIPSARNADSVSQTQLLSGACSDVLTNVAPSLRTNLLGQQYLRDLNDGSLSPSVMGAVVTQLKMNVDLSNHWRVTYGGSTIMDSTDAGYWPACIDNNNCQQTGSNVQAAMAPGWSTVFRNCATANVALGSCDGGGKTAELNMLKWRVTQAMWMIAASAGVLPQGMITQPIPAVFTDWCAQGCSGTYIPTGTATFYTGKAVSAPPSWCNGQAASCSMLDNGDRNTSAGDVRAVGPIFSVSPAFGAFENGVTQEVPYWYRDIYSSTYAPYVKHIVTSNDATSFSQCGVGHQGQYLGNPFAPNPCAGTPPPVQVSLAALVSRASRLEGAKCNQNFGPPASGSEATDVGSPQWSQPWWATVTNAKLGVPYDGALASSVPAYNSGWDGSGSTLLLPASRPGGVPNGANESWSPGWDNPRTPTSWPPSARALSFSGYGTTPNGTCGAVSLLLQASALACTPSPVTAQIAGLTLSSPPQVTHLTDIPVLAAWLLLAKQGMSSVVGDFYVQEIPKRVVDDFARGTIGSGSLGGTKGQAILAMEQQIQAFPSAWTQIATDLGSIQSAIQIANLAIAAAGLNEQTTEGQLALQTMQVQAQMTASTDQLMQTISGAVGSAWATKGGSLVAIPAAIIASSHAVASGQAEIDQIRLMGSTASQVEKNQLAQALAQLGATTGPLWADVQKQLDSLRGFVAQVDATGQLILQAQNQAAYQAAIGTGQDFVNISGQEVPIPVNTVLRRQSSATLRRYQAALTNAKALAYMARRAVEQRIGVTLDALTQQVGPLDAPASWADDVCSLQGVNYASLAHATPTTDADGGAIDGGGIGGSSDQQAISQFANGWVGDYVAKLRSFVTYYNVQYPSHQGSDTSVLSLRYDLLGPVAQCLTRAPNLLVNSGNLSEFSTSGWRLTPCDPNSQKCLTTVGGYALAAPQDGPWGPQGDPSTASGITWLSDVPQVNTGGGGQGGGFGSDAGVTPLPDGGGAADASSPSAGWPNNLVAQQVQLGPGSYVLSWWDQARDANANVQWAGGAAPPNYIVQVFGPSWNSIAIYDQPPYLPPQVGDGGAPSLWSDRHVLSFTVTNAGMYTIAFGASTLAGGNGSVAIADVQLEQGTNGQPTTYVATTNTTMVTGLNCPMSDSDLRASFVHGCDSNGACHYDLNVPMIIDTSTLDGSPLGPKLAEGNYNYRHITAAMNLVGTNVHSCTNNPNPNCYGSGFVQYDLQHDATNAGILGYDGNSRVFNFGVAGIQHGKALTAERYLTVPLSSSDQQLVSQPGFLHIEFGGRPLDGTYRLRIWDSPDLNWSALQDIQIILNYEYWSQIQGKHGKQ